MSLRDQLIKKGLVDAKRARKLDRQAKEERKSKQGQRDKKRLAEARAREAREAAERAAVEERARARKQAELERERAELPARVRQKILANQIRSRGPVPFFVRGPQPERVARLSVDPRVAWKLRAGEAAVAVLRGADTAPELVVISADAARDLREIDPETVRFFVTDVEGIGAPDLAFGAPVDDPDLRARRATPDDIAALCAAAARASD